MTQKSIVSFLWAVEHDSSPSSCDTHPSDATSRITCRVNLAILRHLGYVIYLGKAACDATAPSNESHRVVIIFDATAKATIWAVYP